MFCGYHMGNVMRSFDCGARSFSTVTPPRVRAHGPQVKDRNRLGLLHGANRDVPLAADLAPPGHVIDRDVIGRLYQADCY